MGLCVLAFLFSGRAMLFPEADVEVSREVDAALAYYAEHPYLELDPEFGELVFTEGEREEWLEYYSATVEPPLTGDFREVEQEQLDHLTAKALGEFSAHPIQRFGLVPNDIAPVALVTHMFLHGGWLHLIGNLLILYLAGPFVEDVWGRPLYAGFYIAGGLVAAMAHIGSDPASTVPMIGASGAIAAVMGAFLVRYRHTKIRFFYMVGLFWRGTFSAAAWVMLPLWFAEQLFFGLLTQGTAGAGVAYWAHVGGFVFGVGGALLMQSQQIEERFLRHAIENKVNTEVIDNRAVERAMAAHERGDSTAAFNLLAAELRTRPANADAAMALWGLAVEQKRTTEAAPAMLRAIERLLRAGETDIAVAQWNELVEQLPRPEASAGLWTRLAPALAGRGQEDSARAALRQAMLLAGKAPAAVALRVANAARGIDDQLVRGAARLALTRPDAGEIEQREARRLLAAAAPAASGTADSAAVALSD